MTKKQLIALFVCSLVPWTAGNGLVPLLPVYADEMGADSAITGYYLAFSYIALAVGAFSAGWISERFRSIKMPLFIAGAIGIPTAWLMGRVESIWSLSLLTAMLWLIGGLGLALVSILAGLSAGTGERGKIFGILAITSGLGALIGGLATGYITDRYGFSAMFSAMAVYLVLWPVAALFLKDIHVERIDQKYSGNNQKEKYNRSIHLLLSASLMASIAGFIIILGRSLMMSEMEFSALAISSTGAISGIIAMPIPFLFGWLSDRTGRKLYLYIGYLAGIASLLFLGFSQAYWQFLIVMVLQALLTNINSTVGNALVTDLSPKRQLGKTLALFSATGWIGGVLGFALAGFTLQNLGTVPTAVIGIALPAIAMILLIPVRAEMRTG